MLRSDTLEHALLRGCQYDLFIIRVGHLFFGVQGLTTLASIPQIIFLSGQLSKKHFPRAVSPILKLAMNLGIVGLLLICSAAALSSVPPYVCSSCGLSLASEVCTYYTSRTFDILSAFIISELPAPHGFLRARCP